MAEKFEHYTGSERRKIAYGFGYAHIRAEGGWNHDITRGGVERRRNHPDHLDYDAYDSVTNSYRKCP